MDTMTSVITATGVLDCPAWAWNEVSGEVVGQDRDFYMAHREDLDRVAIAEMARALPDAWADYGFPQVFTVAPEAYLALVSEYKSRGGLTPADETCFQVWLEAAKTFDFADMVEAANLNHEYQTA